MQEPSTTNPNRIDLANPKRIVPANLNHIDLDSLPPLIDVDTAAAIRGNCTAFIRAKCRDGSIKATKLGDSWRIITSAFLAQCGLK